METMTVIYFIAIGAALLGAFFIWSSIRNYKNRPLNKNWRMMTAIPGYGKYWGLASQGVMGFLAIITAILIPFMMKDNGPISVPSVIFVFSALGGVVVSMLLSYWLPQRWIPQWLKDAEREEAIERERRRRVKQEQRHR